MKLGLKTRVYAGMNLRQSQSAFLAVCTQIIQKVSPSQVALRLGLLPVDDEDSDRTESDDFILEDRDDDEQDSEDTDYGEISTATLCTPRSPSAVLDLNDIYAIRVLVTNGRYKCIFPEPDWMKGLTDGPYESGATQIRELLRGIARWFQEHRQTFLEKTIPENFVGQEGVRNFDRDDPLVTHRGFLSAIGVKDDDLDSMASALSRLLPHIWFVW
ncbi:MAG TPA: hypothetical protein PKH07_15625, partial [bacterium]|nr:hypothetical protein [bacterium]